MWTTAVVEIAIYAICIILFQIGTRGLFLGSDSEHARGILQQLCLPLRDLVRMHIELLCQRGCVVTAGASHFYCSLAGDFRRPH